MTGCGDKTSVLGDKQTKRGGLLVNLGVIISMVKPNGGGGGVVFVVVDKVEYFGVGKELIGWGDGVDIDDVWKDERRGNVGVTTGIEYFGGCKMLRDSLIEANTSAMTIGVVVVIEVWHEVIIACCERDGRVELDDVFVDMEWGGYTKREMKRMQTNSRKYRVGKMSIVGLVVKTLALTVVLVLVFGLVYVARGVDFHDNLVEVEAIGHEVDLIAVSGTGSMYPTFEKGIGQDPKKLARQTVGQVHMFAYPMGMSVGGQKYFDYQIGRGDLVSIENEEILELTKEISGRSAGWLKRVVGVAWDILELRDGMVYLNDAPLTEAYTALARGTFGGKFLKECERVVVPTEHIFVMGDNRKGSGDSREIGFVSLDSVDHVLPLEKQIGILDQNWRETDNDLEDSAKIQLDLEEYLRLLNERRVEGGVVELKGEELLEKSAKRRGEVMLEYDDLTYEAEVSGITMQKAMQELGYRNIVYGEAPIQGYYEAQELVEKQFAYPKSSEFLLNENYDEIGVAVVEGELNGCPTQIIVQHFGGYVPPDYKREDIEAWKTALQNLKEIQPEWQELKNFEEFYAVYTVEVDRVNEIIAIRIANITKIVARMEANEWFGEDEKQMIADDQGLGEEQLAISKRLNERIAQLSSLAR
jgi:signal peptidase I